MTTAVEYVKPDGTFVDLPRLRVSQIVDLADEVRRGKIQTITEMNLDDASRVDAITDLDQRGGLAGDVLMWAYTARGTVRIIEESLKLLDNGTKIDDLALDLSRDVRLAVKLLGFELAEKVEKQVAESDPTAAALSGISSET